MPLLYTDTLQNDVELSRFIKSIILSDDSASQPPPPPSPAPALQDEHSSHKKYIVSILVCLLASLTNGDVLFHLQLNTIILIGFG